MRHRVLAALLAVNGVLAVAPAVAPAQPYVHHPNAVATGTGGAAATVDSVATTAAIDALRHGGNAVDAAVTAAGVLGVVEPFSCGLGGGGFMVIRTADGHVTTIDGRETAAFAMRPDSFWQNGAPLPFQNATVSARFSGMSAGVPGTPATWEKALREYGTFSLARALAPGIDVARTGFVIDPTFYGQVQGALPWFDDFPATARIYLNPDGTPHAVGTVQRNPDLAGAYERLADLGVERGFYRGPIASAMVRTVQRPPVAPTADHGYIPGVMTTGDLRAYRAIERPPTHVNYRGLDVYGMGPPSSGGSTVGEALNILKGYDLSSMTRAQALHLYLEASRFAYADRNAYLADPAYYDVPLRGLLSDGFAAARRALINPTHAANSPVAPGDPYPFEGSGAEPGAAKVTTTDRGPGTTTNLTVTDRFGNVVEYTFTIESIGGNAMVVPGWGFLLNNELTDFNYGSLTHPNRVEGGKRPRSSMSPTILLRGGRPYLAVGSPGGATIITTVLQILVDRLDLGMTLPDAIADPRASQRNAAVSDAEPAFIASPVAATLTSEYGQAFGNPAEIGAATGIDFLDGGLLQAAAEPVRRGGGSALVVTPQT